MRPALSRPGHTYAEMDAKGAITNIFDGAERYTWDDDLVRVLDISSLRPRPIVGDVWNGRRFARTLTPSAVEDAAAVIERRPDLIALAELIRQYMNALQAGTYAQKSSADVKSDLANIMRDWK